MSTLQRISGAEAMAILKGAAKLGCSIAVSAQFQNRWLSFHSQVLDVSQDILYVLVPVSADEVKAEEVLVGKESGVSLRMRNYRYFFNTTFLGPYPWTAPDGKEHLALTTSIPPELERLERRAADRVDVPSNRSVRASIWASVRRQPIWAGSVMNLSMGGFQLHTTGSSLAFFEPGDLVTASLSFGTGAEPIEVETHFRHGVPDGSMALLGLEFTVLNTTPQGRAFFEMLMAKIAEFSKD